MAVFKCQLCGGLLDVKPGETTAVCKFCGARQTISEEKTAAAQGGPDTSALIDRGSLALEDGDWSKAEEVFDQVLNINPRCAEAYLGMAMAKYRLANRMEFTYEYLSGKSGLDKDRNVVRARQFAASGLKDYFDSIDFERQRKAQELEAQAQKQLARRRDTILPEQLISAGGYQTVALKSDGTAMITRAVFEGCHSGQGEVEQWTDLKAVAAGVGYTVGLRRDGTVVSSAFSGKPESNFGQCQVFSWKNILAVACGFGHTVGLREDSTVVAVGDNRTGQCQVEGWTNITAVAAGKDCTVGLRQDGTVAFAGPAGSVGPVVESWTGIVAVSAGMEHVLGLQADGTVVVASAVNDGRCRVEEWRGIVAVSAGNIVSLGLRADGTVLATVGAYTDPSAVGSTGEDNVGGWRNIAAISAGCLHSVGLTKDGVVVTTGYNVYGACQTDGWRLFNSVDTLAQEFAQNSARKNAEVQNQVQQRDREALLSQYEALQKEYRECRGLFNGKRRREIAMKLFQIEQELGIK